MTLSQKRLKQLGTVSIIVSLLLSVLQTLSILNYFLTFMVTIKPPQQMCLDGSDGQVAKLQMMEGYVFQVQ